MLLGDLAAAGLLVVLGLLAAWLRWGRLGLLAFFGLVRTGIAPRPPDRPRLTTSRPVRLLLLSLAFFLIGWAGVLTRADLQALGAIIVGGG